KDIRCRGRLVSWPVDATGQSRSLQDPASLRLPWQRTNPRQRCPSFGVSCLMTSQLQSIQHQTRRHFLSNAGQLSLGALAMESFLRRDAGAAASAINPLAPHKPHYDAKVKRVIYLHMSGGPPHLDI